MLLDYAGERSTIAVEGPYRSKKGIEAQAAQLQKLVLRFRKLLREAACDNWAVSCNTKKPIGTSNSYTITRSFRAHLMEYDNDKFKLSVYYTVSEDKPLRIPGSGSFTPELGTDIHFVGDATTVEECWIQVVTSRLIGIDTGFIKKAEFSRPLPATDLLSLAGTIIKNCNYGPIRPAQRATFQSGRFLGETVCNRVHATGAEQITRHAETIKVLLESLRD